MGFYAIPFGVLIGDQNAWIVMAVINFFFCLPLVPLYFSGA
jgi:hypothetical protein